MDGNSDMQHIELVKNWLNAEVIQDSVESGDGATPHTGYWLRTLSTEPVSRTLTPAFRSIEELDEYCDTHILACEDLYDLISEGANYPEQLFWEQEKPAC
jgi:hypothetical protein